MISHHLWTYSSTTWEEPKGPQEVGCASCCWGVAFVPQPVVFPFQLFVSAEIFVITTINVTSLGTSCEMFTLHPGPGGMSRESDWAQEIWSFPSQSTRSQEIVLYWSVVSCFCVWGHRHEERKGIVFTQVSYVRQKRKNHKSILAKRSLRDYIFHSVQIRYVHNNNISPTHKHTTICTWFITIEEKPIIQ